MSFRAILVVGNKKGKIGVGVGKASEIKIAIQKGLTNGRGNIILIPLTNTNSIPHSTIGKFKASKLILRPSTPGSGVIAGSSMRTVLEMVGIKNILSKQLGSNHVIEQCKSHTQGIK